MKKRIAVIFGGHSTEYDVSLQSSFSVLQNINKSHFEIVPVGITRDGEWYHYTGKIENISNNSWIDDEENLYPIMVSQSRLAQGFREFYGNKCREIPIDLVFPILHGKNGEDGTLQGLFELAGIPVVVWTRTGRINLSALQESLFLNRYLSGVLKKKQLIGK